LTHRRKKFFRRNKKQQNYSRLVMTLEDEDASELDVEDSGSSVWTWVSLV
jgi:hypothetical protein